MIIFKYISTEVLKVTFAILGILLLVFISQQFVRFLGDFASGEISGQMVAQLLALQVPVIFSFLFPLSLFLGVLLGLGRLYVDAEITVLRACGVGQRQIAVYGLIPSFALAILTALLTLFLAPWATEQQYALFDERAASAELLLLQPGKFQPSSDGTSMMFIQDIQEGEIQEVFVARLAKRDAMDGAEPETHLDLTLAKKGKIIAANADNAASMVLDEGSHYEVKPGKSDIVHDRFGEFFMKLSDAPTSTKERKHKALSSAQLLENGEAEDWAELQWRLSVPLSLPILFLLAVPLSRVKPRQGKFAKIVPGILLYSLYMVGLLSLRSALDKGKVPLVFGLWWIHFLMLFFTLYIYRKTRRV